MLQPHILETERPGGLGIVILSSETKGAVIRGKLEENEKFNSHLTI